MKKTLLYLFAALAILASAVSCKTSTKSLGSIASQDQKHEFRGAWIQTAFQDRYTSKTPEQCRRYFDQLIATLKQSGFNVVIFQVRPEGDAFYQSELEPWSRFLTGRQGKAPSPVWDPTAYLIQLCHDNQMEFHAWINPYRMYASKKINLSTQHLYYKHPEWFVVYDERLYLNPGLPECRSWIRQVVKDIVTRYDVDAIHMDDYFYPYPAAGKEFNDKTAFETYGPQMGFNTTKLTDLANFRRQNVNILIKSVNEDIKSIKPWVRFGISPFGIYRNKKTWEGGSNTNGTQCYDDLYADVLKWANEGWIDYVIPQIYWEIGHQLADYTTLCQWWAKNTPTNCQLYIGQSIERSLDGSAKSTPTPDLRTSHENFSKKLTQAYSEKNVKGNCFWYAYQVEDNQFHVRDFLKQEVFKKPAMAPAYTHLSSAEPASVTGLDGSLVRADQGLGLHLQWKAPVAKNGQSYPIRYYNVYRFTKGEKVQTNNMKHLYTQVSVPELYDFNVKNAKYTYVVTAVDYYNNESKPVKESFKIKVK